jgi:peptidyl-prolyl cis-trans isomerase B (cyclophilin B)
MRTFCLFTILQALLIMAVTKPASADKLYAVLETSKGTIELELYPDKTPLTVASFVNLVQRGFYDGLKFHRVIDNFMVQGGDPLGKGSGGPGYKFEDEFAPDLRFTGPGVLAMANAGPGTNGSQFFITHVATDWLNDHHTIFGHVVKGQEVVNAIRQGDVITKATIKGDPKQVLAKEADRIKAFNSVLDKQYPAKNKNA